jgi:uncharacterized protein (TIGR03435 family)
MRWILIVALDVSLGFTSLAAQDPSPRFEVTSVKPVELTPGPTFAGFQFQTGGRFTATNVTVMMLLPFAFREPGASAVRPNEVLNAPPWVNTQHFNIDARMAPELAAAVEPLATTAPAAIALVRSLLEDRFKMQAHAETRELQVYALTLARKDGKLGPNMKPSTVDCAAITRDRAAAQRAGTPLPLPSPPAPGQIPQCGGMIRSGEIAVGGTTIAALPAALAPALPGATIVDHTGLTGSYDVLLKFAPESPTLRATPGAADAALPDAPSIFTAVEEQLGLKLEPMKEERRVIVVDHIEQPIQD